MRARPCERRARRQPSARRGRIPPGCGTVPPRLTIDGAVDAGSSRPALVAPDLCDQSLSKGWWGALHKKVLIDLHLELVLPG